MSHAICSLYARVPAATTAPAGKRAPTRRAPVVINPKPSSNSRCVARLPRGAVVARGRKGMLAELMDDGVDGPAETPADTTCPCGSGGEYDACCGALHSGAGSDDAEPEAIVRARFSAYVKNIPAYIVSSTHPDSKDLKRKDDPKEALEQLEKDAAATMKQVSFKSIRKMKASAGGEADEAFVSYEVAYKGAGKKSRSGAKTLAERSRYKKSGGVWKYMDALPLNGTKDEGKI